MAKDNVAPIAVLVTQTKIQIAPPAEAKPTSAPKVKIVRVAVPAKTKETRKAIAKPKPPKEVTKAATVKAPKPKTVKTSKAPAPKPTNTPNLASKNQEAVQAGKVPSRREVEPGRYDMLLG